MIDRKLQSLHIETKRLSFQKMSKGIQETQYRLKASVENYWSFFVKYLIQGFMAKKWINDQETISSCSLDSDNIPEDKILTERLTGFHADLGLIRVKY